MFGSLITSRLSAALSIGLAALLVLFTPIDSKAQLTRGSISGTVTDGKEMPMAGVTVTLLNTATGISEKRETNEVGAYRFSALEPGYYLAEFQQAGFAAQEIPVLVTTGVDRLINPVLALGPIKVRVVDTGASLLKTSPTIEQTIFERMIMEIPTMDSGALIRELSRNTLLAPGSVRVPGQNAISSGGQRGRNFNWLMDGIDNNEGTVTMPAAEIPPEAVLELQIQVMSFSAEYGRNTGPQFNVITKSGTNRLHGSLWDYYTGNWLEPVTLPNKRNGVNSTPRFVHNRGGADLGGPIIKNRTFFYGLVQANVRREAPNALNGTVANIPTPAGYQALLTAPLGSGQSVASRDAMLNALTFLPEIHSQLAAGCPVSNSLCAYSGAASQTVNGTPIELGSIQMPLARPASVWDVVTRVDHLVGPNDRLFFRYNLNRRDQPNTTSNLQFGERYSGGLLIPAQSFAVSYIKITGSNFVNEARYGYHRVTGGFEERDPVSATVSLTNLFTIGGLRTFPQSRQEDVHQLQNVSTWLKGRHAIKFGADVRRNILFNNNAPDSKGTWAFTNLQNFMNNTGTLTQAVSVASLFTARQWNQYYFFQDDFRPVRDLTINLGIRYETSSVPLGMFGATLPEVLAVGVPGPAQRDTNNWAPRVGFAYSPSNPSGIWERLLGHGQTVIRGGAGVSYDVLFYNILTITASTAYPLVTQTDNVTDQFPTLLPKTAGAPAVSPTATFANTPVNIQNPTTHYWTLSVQRQVGREYTFEVGYMGSRSYHMLRQNQANPPILTQAQADTVLAGGSIPSAANRRVNPAWGSRQLIESTGKGEYHAGYVRVDKKFSHGFLVGANYTWGANFSDSEELTSDSTIATGSPQVPQDFGNLRNEWSRSIFDRPHRFSAHYIYEIPWFTASAPILRQILGGWQVAGFTEFQSGQPFTLRVGVDAPGNSASSSFPPGRPNFNPGGILLLDPVTNDMRTFTIPCDGTGIVSAPRSPSATTCAGSYLANTMPGGGTLGRNTFRGPSFQNWNVSLMKRIALQEDRMLELRADLINALNHNNFGIPDPVMNSSTFGTNTGALVTDQRQILLTGKLKF